MLAFVVALVVRALAALWVGPAQPQEIRYITIARSLLEGRGFAGLDQRFPDIIQPPLYPMLLLPALALPVDGLAAARGVSLLMGALLVFPVAALATRLFGSRAGNRAGWLAAFHPLLIHVSSEAITESTFVLLVTTAALVLWRLSETTDPPPRRLDAWFVAAGTLLGLAYLTRPEGLAYVVAGGIVAAIGGGRSLRKAARGPLLIAALFAAAAIPYIIWVHGKTGQWLLAPKAVLAQVHRQLAEQGRLEGWPEPADSMLLVERAKFSLTADGHRLRSHDAFGKVLLGFAEGVLVSDEDGTPLTSPRSALRIVGKNVSDLYLETLKHGYVIPPLLLMLGAAGLVAQPWVGPLRRRVIPVAIFFVASFSFILAPLQSRFLYAAICFALPWVALGWCELESRVQVSLSSRGEGRGGRRLAVVVVAALVLGPSASHLLPALRMAGSVWLQHRELGLKLRGSLPASARLMATTPVVSYYAGVGFEVLPYADLPSVIRYARYRKADYLVAAPKEIRTLRPQLEILLEQERPHPGLTLETVLHERGENAIYLYRVEPEPSAP